MVFANFIILGRDHAFIIQLEKCKHSRNRIDSYYYKEIFECSRKAILNGTYPIQLLKYIALEIKNGVEIREYCAIGYRYLRVTDLGTYSINNNSPRYVDVDNIPPKIKLNNNCVLISRSGSLGLVNIVEPEIENSILSSHIFKVELDTQVVLPKYLESFLRSLAGQREIFRQNNGGVIPEINQTALGSILIPVPPLEKQLKIANHIAAIRNRAKQLQQEAAVELEQTKTAVEQLILGHAAPP